MMVRNQNYVRFILVILTGALGLGSIPTAGQNDGMPGEPLGVLQGRRSKEINPVGSTLGVNINVGANVTEEDLDKLADLGVAWAQVRFRLKRADVRPEETEATGPAGTVLNWDHNDFLVNGIARRGIQIMGHLGGISRPFFDETRHGTGSTWITPVSSLDAMASYMANVAQIVTRYHDKIKVWEIWNEVDSPKFWEPEPNAEEYRLLFRLTREVILGIQPDAKIISGSLTLRFGSSFAEEFIRGGIVSQSDYFGIHPPRHLPEHGDGPWPHEADFSRLLERLRRVNPQIQIWDTEVQALTDTHSADRLLSYASHARLLLRRFLVQHELGYVCTNWQMFKGGRPPWNHPGQLLSYESKTNEKYDAFRNLGSWLDGDIAPSRRFSAEYDEAGAVLAEDYRFSRWAQDNQAGRTAEGVLALSSDLFAPSVRNKVTKYVDIYYFRRLNALDPKVSVLLRRDGELLDLWPDGWSGLDCRDAFYRWFRLEGDSGGLFVVVPKGQPLDELAFELVDIEARLRRGLEVRIPASMFVPHGKNPLRYKLSPIAVSPSGAGFRVFVNGTEWPHALVGLRGRPMESFYTIETDTLVLNVPDDFVMADSEIILAAADVSPVHLSRFEHRLKKHAYLAYWQTTYPVDDLKPGRVDLTLRGIDPDAFKSPVLVDFMSGRVYDISQQVSMVGQTFKANGLPLLESPLLIAPKGSIRMKGAGR